MRKRRLWTTAGGLLVVAALAASATQAVARAPHSGKTFMTCGEPAKLSYVVHPRYCSYTFDGSEAHRVTLLQLHWRHWGARRATASGLLKDNHDQDHNGFQRHRVHIVLSDPQRTTAAKSYYLKLRISGVHFYRYSYIPMDIPQY